MGLFKYVLTFPNGDILDSQEEDDETFSSYEDAEDAALYAISCSKTGAEILHMSNPGDYDEYGEDDEFEYEIEEID